jgi:hypothetical protein
MDLLTVESRKENNLEGLYQQLKPQDLIFVCLKHCMLDACTENDLHRIVLFVHNKYKDLPDDFDGHLFLQDSIKLSGFFTTYARLMSEKNKAVGWHPNVLSHAVRLNHLKIMID